MQTVVCPLTFLPRKGQTVGMRSAPGTCSASWVTHWGAYTLPSVSRRIFGGENFSESSLGDSALAVIFWALLSLEYEMTTRLKSH